jgi:hypothetical protein
LAFPLIILFHPFSHLNVSVIPSLFLCHFRLNFIPVLSQNYFSPRKYRANHFFNGFFLGRLDNNFPMFSYNLTNTNTSNNNNIFDGRWHHPLVGSCHLSLFFFPFFSILVPQIGRLATNSPRLNRI